MRDNLIFSGITESSGEEVEKTLKQSFINELQMDVEMVEKIQFDRVHGLQHIRENQGKPRLMMAKFERFKDKAPVKSSCKHLAGQPYGVNN